MAWGGVERRIFPRADFPCKIKIISKKNILVSHTENISKGGIRVILEEKLNYFEIVSLELFFKKDEPIKCEGRIAWVIEKMNPLEGQPIMFDTGIAFKGLSGSDREYIKNLVDMILSIKSKPEEKSK